MERNSAKPLENLRPQHLLDALLWPQILKGEAVLAEEFNEENARYYVLTVLRGGYNTEILRKIWFDRADLSVARLQGYGSKGALIFDVRYSDWQPVDEPGGATNSPQKFARAIRIDRPHDDYRLELQFTKIALNEVLPEERFQLAQPPGSELVHVGAENDKNQPAKDARP
jgi:outer membrane lipoprotein-sorting protein